MAYEHREGQGSLFVNDRKEKESQPDYTGKLMVGGKTYYLSGWTKGQKPKEFYSLALGPEVGSNNQGASSPAAGGSVPNTPQDDLEDDIPF